jgi:histidinol-phosphate phosphatase family protein
MLIDVKITEFKFKKIIIIDRDDTLIYDKGPLQSINNIEFTPESIEFLKFAADLHYGLIMVTNQSVIGKKIKKRGEVEEINNQIDLILQSYGCRLCCVVMCPHTIHENCRCRKPGNLMIEKAFEISGAEKSKSLVIGNSWVDYMAALESNVNCYIYKEKLIAGEIELPDSILFSSFIEIKTLLN